MKLRNIFYGVCVLFMLVLSCVSCQKEEDIQQKIIKDVSTSIKLGQQINDPYRLENMQQAYYNLYGNSLKNQLLPTHKYIRFLPKNESELDLLKSDTSIVLYDYPLDYEINESEGAYHDASLPDTCITWQYTVVPYDYQIPDVFNELIYDVFIPDNENLELKSCNLYELEEEAYRITGNIDKGKESVLKASRWHPSGNISVWDDLFNQCIPLKGAKIQTRWSTNIKTCVTDENGDFYQEYAFLYQVNYAIKWEGNDFDIRDGSVGQAWYNGPKQGSSWTLRINGGKSLGFATIHRAAHRFYYENNSNVYKLNGGQREKIAYKDKSWDKGSGREQDVCSIIPGFNDIVIFGKHNYQVVGIPEYYYTFQILETTLHELGHRSHLEFMGFVKYETISTFVCESWAEAISWVLLNDEYRKMALQIQRSEYLNYTSVLHNDFEWESTTTGEHRNYSPIFIDLIDDINQKYYEKDKYGNKIKVTNISPNIPDDEVTGFTLEYIQEKILPTSFGVSSLKESIRKNNISTVRSSDLETLLSYY